MGYEGYSIVGDLNDTDYMKELREKGLQKEALRKQMRAEMEGNFELFKAYIDHSYSITTLPDEMKKMLEMIENNFSGMAKQALTQRYIRNSLQLDYINLNKNLLQHSFAMKKGFLWF